MVAGTIERIQVRLQLLTKGFVAGLGRAQTHMRAAGKNMHDFGAVMKVPVRQLGDLNKRFKVMRSVGGRVAKSFRLMTHGMRGFRMEMLGVMFFGMMMQRMFTGLLRPVMEAFGVFDLFRLMLLILFLPVMEMIFPFLLKLMDIIINLEPSTKKIIGIFVLLGATLGAILFIIGSFALGLGSLILVFGSLAGWVGIAIAAILGFVGLKFLIDLFRKVGNASEEASSKLTAFGISGETISIIKEKIKSLIEDVAGMTETWEEAGKGIAKKLIKGVKDYLIENPAVVIGAMIGAWFGGPIGATIGAAIGLLFSNIDFEKIKELVDKGLEVMGAIVQGMFDNSDKIFEGMSEIAEKITEWIANNGGKLFLIGLALIAGIVKGMVFGIGKFFDKFIGPEGSLRGGKKGNVKSANDFIWRPGQSPLNINPKDTLVGFKGGAPGLGGGEGNIVLENNFYGFTMEDLKRELDDRDRRLVNDIRRQGKQ